MNGREQGTRVTGEPEGMVQMISFTIGVEQFGVGILNIKEINMMSDITKIPNAPDFVEGVINLRGSIIPILDLRKRLRLEIASGDEGIKAGSRILVVEIEGNTTGFIVDSVSKVLTVPAAKVFPPPDILVAGVESQYISGVVHLDEGILIILDFKRILSVEEKGQLERVSRMMPESSSTMMDM